jgi:hypothetical protein
VREREKENDEKMFTIEVQPSDSIGDVKKKIHVLEKEKEKEKMEKEVAAVVEDDDEEEESDESEYSERKKRQCLTCVGPIRGNYRWWHYDSQNRLQSTHPFLSPRTNVYCDKCKESGRIPKREPLSN